MADLRPIFGDAGFNANAYKATPASPIDLEDRFRAALVSAEIQPNGHIYDDGKWHRLPVSSKARKNEDATYWYRQDGALAWGGYYNHHLGIAADWTSKADRELTPAEKVRIKVDGERIKAELEQKRQQAAKDAQATVHAAQPADPNHPYLTRKKAPSAGLYRLGDAILIPITNIDGEIQSYQTVIADGTKKYLADGAKQGNLHLIGKPGPTIYVVEGYATGSTVAQATGHGVFVAFDCGNLLPVCEAIRARYTAPIVICGDNDQYGNRNMGMEKAQIAAQKVAEVTVVTPKFQRTDNKPTDFNDLHLQEGLDAVRHQIGAATIPELPLAALELPASDAIPPRPWLYGHLMMRGAVTLISAPGGTGKTALTAVSMLALATGRPLLGPKPLRQLKVAFLALEENKDEMHRRFAAASMHYSAPMAAFANHIHILDGHTYRFTVADVDPATGAPRRHADADRLKAAILAIQADAVALDPFALCHGLVENDNTHMAFLMNIFTEIAQSTNCAIVLVHHTKKGSTAGDVDSIRGGGALVNHARIAIGLSPMDAKDASQWAIPDQERRTLVRIDDLKKNYSVKSAQADWIKLVSVELGNRTNDYPFGDSVQVATVWTPETKGIDMDIEVFDEIFRALELGISGSGGIERYSAAPNASVKAAWRLVQQIHVEHDLVMPESEARSVVAKWLKSDKPLLYEKAYSNPTSRKSEVGIFLMQANLQRLKSGRAIDA